MKEHPVSSCHAMRCHFSHVQLFVTLWIATCQAPLSMGCSRQEYWSGLTFLPSGDLPDSGIEPLSPWGYTFLSRWHGDTGGQESACQCKRHVFNPRVRKIPCSKKPKPIPAFLLGGFHGQRSLAGYSPCGHKELDMTD